MTDTIELSGGCQCGAVRYRADGVLDEAGVCHCRMCQKASGNFGMAFFSAPELTFTRGTPGTFESSPGIHRGFCQNCGSPLFMQVEGKPYDMTVGSLDHPDDLPPMKSQIAIESECRWFRDLASVPKYPLSATYAGGEPEITRSYQHPDYDTEDWEVHHG